ncbi:MAG: carboxymuconolactone decarboxylase family protein [Alphaproteobacteria bacterium]|nr:carboxymuconolactone decarboxylase family protein [Alphaproteobacteria bacterium]
MRIYVPRGGDPTKAFETLSNAYAPEIVRAAGAFSTTAYQHTKLTLREIEAARYRTAQINGCMVCMGFRAGRDFPQMFEGFGGDVEASTWARSEKPDEALYENVGNWRDWPGYSERERLAIQYAEGMGEAPKEIAVDEAFWAQMKAAYSDEEIVDLTYCIGSWIANGRAAHVLGLDNACFAPDVAEAAE